MKLRPRFRRRNGGGTPEDHIDARPEQALNEQGPDDRPLGHPWDTGDTSSPETTSYSRFSRRIFGFLPRRSREQRPSGASGGDSNDPGADPLAASDAVLDDAGAQEGGTLGHILARGAGADDQSTAAGLLGGSEWIDEAGDEASREDATAVRFDTRASTFFEPLFRYMLLAGMVCLIIVLLVGGYQIRQLATGGSASAQTGAEAQVQQGTSTAPDARAGELAEGFAAAYLAFPGSSEAAAGEYLANLEPYLHPDADPDLFAATGGNMQEGARVSYAAASRIEPAPGKARYQVLVDARVEQPAGDGSSGPDSLLRTVAVNARVPESGGQAYVVAPPRVTEVRSGAGAGEPGIYGYEDAQTLDEGGPLNDTLQDFLEALYAPTDSRPLVEEEMVEDARVPNFPPEEHAYEGVERAAVYYREDLDEAEEQGFVRLYDLEVYVRVTDEATGRTRLDSWALTAGENKGGGFKITSVS